MDWSVQRILGAVTFIAILALSGCSTTKDQGPPPDELTARGTEAMLQEAGFTRIDVEEPSDELKSTPYFKLNQHQTDSGLRFWYYDPDYCGCLYDGDQNAADRYAMELQQQKDLAAYEGDYETEESAAQQAWMASAYNGGIPSPYFWGGWYDWYGCGMGYYYCAGAPPPGWGGGSGKGGSGKGGGGKFGGGGVGHGAPPPHTGGPHFGGFGGGGHGHGMGHSI